MRIFGRRVKICVYIWDIVMWNLLYLREAHIIGNSVIRTQLGTLLRGIWDILGHSFPVVKKTSPEK